MDQTMAAPDFAKVAPMLINVLMSLAVLFTMIWGFVLCFFGYRILRIILAFYGFVGGVAVAMYLNLFVFHTSGIETVLLVFGLGILGALVSIFLLYVGVFLLGALLGAGVALFVGMLISKPIPGSILIAAGVAGGVVTLLRRRFVIVLFTALEGALQIVWGGLYMMDDPFIMALPKIVLAPHEMPWKDLLDLRHLVAGVIWLGITALGVYCQYVRLGAAGFVSGKDRHTQRHIAEAMLEEQRERAAELREHRAHEGPAQAPAKDAEPGDQANPGDSS